MVELFALRAVRCGDKEAGRNLPQRDGGGGIGRSGERGRNARDDLIGDAGLAERRELFAGAPKDHRVAGFEARHALALARQAGQQGVDLRLGEGMVTLALAHRDALGVPPAHFDDRVGDQLVVDDDVGGLQQALRAQRQQIFGTGTSPDQPDLAGRAGGVRFEQGFGFANAAHQIFVKAAGLGFAQHGRDALTERTGETRKAAEVGWKQRFDTRADQPREYRRIALGGNRNRQRGAVDDRGREEIAFAGDVDDVHRNAAGPRVGFDAIGEFALCRNEHEGRAVQDRAVIRLDDLGADGTESVGGCGGNNDDRCSRLYCQSGFVERFLSIADNDDAPAAHLVAQGECVQFTHSWPFAAAICDFGLLEQAIEIQ